MSSRSQKILNGVLTVGAIKAVAHLVHFVRLIVNNIKEDNQAPTNTDNTLTFVIFAIGTLIMFSKYVHIATLLLYMLSMALLTFTLRAQANGMSIFMFLVATTIYLFGLYEVKSYELPQLQ